MKSLMAKKHVLKNTPASETNTLKNHPMIYSQIIAKSRKNLATIPMFFFPGYEYHDVLPNIYSLNTVGFHNKGRSNQQVFNS